MSKRPTFESFKKTAMQDAEFRAEYELLREEFELIEKLITARKKVRCSQSELVPLSLEPKKRRS